eukprot:13167662-Alexandrium_andersonii.AAC.1
MDLHKPRRAAVGPAVLATGVLTASTGALPGALWTRRACTGTACSWPLSGAAFGSPRSTHTGA